MRVVLAYDASTGADVACDLLANLRLPEATTVIIVGVQAPLPTASRPSSSDDPAEIERHLVADLESKLEAAAERLAGRGWTVERRVFEGRPAETILAEAARVDADLIVMGSRGYGPFTSAMLGSVSTEVVSASTRPVLVARGRTVRRVLLATDGTDTSTLALEIVATWPIFADLEIRVVSVSEPAFGLAAVERAESVAYLLDLEATLADQSRAIHEEMARAAARRIADAGRSATDEVRVGNAGHEIVQAAEEAGADLIVTGSRRVSAALPGAIGSVARNVLHNAQVSVLVVREPTTVEAESAALEDLGAVEAGPTPEP